MRNVLTIFQKELRSYFDSPVAWGLMAFFAVLAGLMFNGVVQNFIFVGIQTQMQGRPVPLDMNEYVIRPFFLNINVVGLFLIPMITMRTFAEEKRTGTIELLVTSPVRDIEIIIGKWLAATALYIIITSIALLDLSVLFFYGKPDWKPVVVGYLGLVLQGSALLAIGCFLSSLTRNQIIAGAGTFAVSLALYIITWLTEFSQDASAKAVGYMSVLQHYEPFSKGVVDSKDVVFFLTLAFLGLFLTARSMESMRWRA
ncbi:MAG TPA: ABC transporter permease subunit [Bryobacteraceae bacterium]|nr:ABC transporter permease subunit [Bryobacteraceae bacterium]